MMELTAHEIKVGPRLVGDELDIRRGIYKV
jgi:hypothetical protein